MQETPQERAARMRREDAEWLLKQPQFRRWLFEVIDAPAWCGTSASPFVADAMRLAYLEGRRSIGVQLNVEAQEVAPDMVVRMLTEALNTRKRLQAPMVPPPESNDP